MFIEWKVVGRSSLGIGILLGLAYILSRDRKNVNFKIVAFGLFFTCGLAFLMLKVPFVNKGVEAVSTFFIKMVDFSDEGASFLFGDLVNVKSFGFIFAFHVLPNIIFFSAISSVLYYFGILPRIVSAFAWLLTRAMKISGAECASAAANVFLGQITAPILIKPYLPRMSGPEIFSVMTCGMASIAGGIMLAVISILGGEDPHTRLQIATFLLTASILSAPAGLTIAHIILPRSGPVDKSIQIKPEQIGTNAFDSLAKGTEEGLQVAFSIGGILIVFTAAISLANWVFVDGLGNWFHLNELTKHLSGGLYETFSLQSVLGLLFSPFAWILGVSGADVFRVAQILGEKVVLNEVVGYISLNQSINNNVFLNPQSQIIATFALCSFANFTSIGVQISGLSALASNQRSTVSKLALLAVVSGNIACFISTCIATAFILS